MISNNPLWFILIVTNRPKHKKLLIINNLKNHKQMKNQEKPLSKVEQMMRQIEKIFTDNGLKIRYGTPQTGTFEVTFRKPK